MRARRPCRPAAPARRSGPLRPAPLWQRALCNSLWCVILALGLASLAAPRTAQAGRAARACAEIRPEQALSTERAVELELALQARVPGFGPAVVEGSRTVTEAHAVALLEGDALAQAWFVYQLCALRASGVLSEALHDSLMRQTFGLAVPGGPGGPGGPSGPAGPGTAPVGPTLPTPIGAPVSGFLASAGTATLVIAQCPERVARDTTPAVRGIVHWKINEMSVMRGPATGFAVDLPPGRVSVAARYTSLRDQLEFTVEAGQIYALTVDWGFGPLRALRSMDVRPAAPDELGPRLERCFQRERVGS